MKNSTRRVNTANIKIPIQALNIDSIIRVKMFGLLKEFLKRKVMEFQGGSIKTKLYQLKLMTSDPKVLETVSGMQISIVSEELVSVKTYQYPFNKKEKNIEVKGNR